MPSRIVAIECNERTYFDQRPSASAIERQDAISHHFPQCADGGSAILKVAILPQAAALWRTPDHHPLETLGFADLTRGTKPQANMQNRYVGDIGDYVKLALLRELTGSFSTVAG